MGIRKRFHLRLTSAFTAFLALALSAAAGAASTADVLEQTVTPDSIILYVRHTGSSGAEAHIGVDSILGVDVDGDGGTVPAVTWLLVDNSFSIAKNDRKLTQALLTDLVAGRAPNERFVLCTISDHLEPVLYDSADYSELKREIEAIEYHNQETYLTDVLSELLDLQEQRGGEEYVRIVVISDGVDNNPGGITREELAERLKGRNIPIYSVGCKGRAQELKEMYALSRQTGARYWAFSDVEGTWEISSAMSGEEMPTCVRIPVPEALCDGTTKGVQVTFDDGVVVQAQVAMPFGEKLLIPEVKPEPVPEQIVEPEPIVKPEPEPTLADKLREHWLSIVLLALALVLFVPVIIALRQKKARETAETVAGPEPPEDARRPGPTPGAILDTGDDTGTVYMGVVGDLGGSATVSAKSGAPAQPQVTLRLQDTERPEMRFEVLLPAASGLKDGAADAEEGTVSISHVYSPSGATQSAAYDELHVGRAPTNDIVIDYDRTVSGTHCKIMVSGNTVRVCDLGSKNGTFVNGAQVRGSESAIVTNGSTLGLGDASFRLELNRR